MFSVHVTQIRQQISGSGKVFSPFFDLGLCCVGVADVRGLFVSRSRPVNTVYSHGIRVSGHYSAGRRRVRVELGGRDRRSFEREGKLSNLAKRGWKAMVRAGSGLDRQGRMERGRRQRRMVSEGRKMGTVIKIASRDAQVRRRRLSDRS